MTTLINILRRKHTCDFKTISSIKNVKGEKWSQTCKCGRERIVLFNNEGVCVYMGLKSVKQMYQNI